MLCKHARIYHCRSEIKRQIFIDIKVAQLSKNGSVDHINRIKQSKVENGKISVSSERISVIFKTLHRQSSAKFALFGGHALRIGGFFLIRRAETGILHVVQIEPVIEKCKAAVNHRYFPVFAVICLSQTGKEGRIERSFNRFHFVACFIVCQTVEQSANIEQARAGVEYIAVGHIFTVARLTVQFPAANSAVNQGCPAGVERRNFPILSVVCLSKTGRNYRRECYFAQRQRVYASQPLYQILAATRFFNNIFLSWRRLLFLRQRGDLRICRRYQTEKQHNCRNCRKASLASRSWTTADIDRRLLTCDALRLKYLGF